MPTDYFCRPDIGSDSNNGLGQSTAVLNPDAVGPASGDTVKFPTTPFQNSGKTALFTDGSKAVVISAAVTKTLWTEGVWTAVGDTVCGVDSSNVKEGTHSASFNIGTNGIGRIAYYPLGSAVDLSAFQQLSLWAQMMNNATIAPGSLRIDLCSDTTGNTPVASLTNEFNILFQSWNLFITDHGSAFGSSIQSIALYAADSLNGIQLVIDNIVASKAPTAVDCITLGSCIAKSDGIPFPIKSISADGLTITIDNSIDSLVGEGQGYEGVTETVPLWIYTPIYKNLLNYIHDIFSAGSFLYAIREGITFSGGWDVDTMAANQTGLTMISAVNNKGIFLADFASGNCNYQKLAFIRGSFFNIQSGIGQVMSDVYAIGHTDGANMTAGTWTNPRIINCDYVFGALMGASNGILINPTIIGAKNIGYQTGAAGSTSEIYGGKVSNCGSHGIMESNSSGQFSAIRELHGTTISKNGGSGLYLQGLGKRTFIDLTVTGNGDANVVPTNTRFIRLNNNNPSQPYSFFPAQQFTPSGGFVDLEDCTLAEATLYPTAYFADGDPASSAFTTDFQIRKTATDGTQTIETMGAKATWQTTNKATDDDGAWKVVPKQNSITAPLMKLPAGEFLLLGPVDGNPGQSLAIVYNTYLDSANVKARFKIKGGVVPGIGNYNTDIIVPVSSGVIGSWSQTTITLGPATGFGVLEVIFEVFQISGTAGSDAAYVGDYTRTYS